jgi:large subunit ribosomal protein L25
VSGLELGHSLHVADISLPEGVELVSDGELSVVSVLLPRAVETETPVEEGEGAEGEEGAEAAEGEEASEGGGKSAEEEKGD